jgi:hypothetical protein
LKKKREQRIEYLLTLSIELVSKTAGTVPIFAQPAEQNGIVPLSDAVLKLALGYVICMANHLRHHLRLSAFICGK